MTDPHTTDTFGPTAAWQWWLAPALLALALAVLFVDPFAGDWDALDYTVLALEGRPSSMILGRMLFIYANHALWRVAHALFDLQPENAYLLFKYAVVAQSPLAVVAWWVLARDLTGSFGAATAAALLLALSPFFIIYSGQAMTEIPSLLLLAVALTIHLRGVRTGSAAVVLAGAALLGMSVNVREATALYAPWLILAPLACGWKAGRREVATTALACLIFTAFAFGGFALWYLMDVGGYRNNWHGWIESARMEATLHPVSLGNFRPLLLYFFLAAPLVLVTFPAAAASEWKRRGFTPLLVLAAIGFLANISLILHYSVVINGRYLLTGLPAMTPLVADYFMRVATAKVRDMRRAFLSVVICVAFVAMVAGHFAWPSGSEYVANRTLTKDYRARLALLPRDAVVMAGSQTVAVTYWRGVGAGEWDVIGTGGGWPGAQLASVIERYLKDGRRVFLDADPRWWATSGWQAEETRALAGLEARFRFRRISETIYEVRPPDDRSARDTPNLQNLLPAVPSAETVSSK